MTDLRVTIAQMAIVDATLTRLGIPGRFTGGDVTMKTSDPAQLIVKLQVEKLK